jgi:hypothetical protein
MFIEERLTMGRLMLVGGLRNDITIISGSEYGTAASPSPRFNARYNIIKGKNGNELRRSVPERKRFLMDCGPRRSAPRKTVRNIG